MTTRSAAKLQELNNMSTPPLQNQEVSSKEDPDYEEEEEEVDDDIGEMEDDDNDDNDEEVTLSELQQEQTKKFTEQVKRMCFLENKLSEMNNERKVFADEKNALRQEIIAFMASKGIGDVNFGEEEIIYLDTREQSNSLTRPALMKAVKDYYEVGDLDVTKEMADAMDEDTQVNLADAQHFFDHIQNFVGKSEKIVLVRERKDKKKRARKTAVPISVYKKPKAAKKRKKKETEN